MNASTSCPRLGDDAQSAGRRAAASPRRARRPRPDRGTRRRAAPAQPAQLRERLLGALADGAPDAAEGVVGLPASAPSDVLASYSSCRAKASNASAPGSVPVSSRMRSGSPSLEVEPGARRRPGDHLEQRGDPRCRQGKEAARRISASCGHSSNGGRSPPAGGDDSHPRRLHGGPSMSTNGARWRSATDREQLLELVDEQQQLGPGGLFREQRSSASCAESRRVGLESLGDLARRQRLVREQGSELRPRARGTDCRPAHPG